MNKVKTYLGTILLVVMLFILLFLLWILFGTFDIAKQDYGNVGAIFIDNVDDGGWNERHYDGLVKACDELGLKFEIVENVKENPEDVVPAVEQLVKKGCGVIFLTSDGYGDNLRDIYEQYQDIEFYTVAAVNNYPNVTSYFARIYQARYLTGMIAGKMTKSNILGFVGGENTPQTIRGINAFCLGARAVNPDVVVKVRYINSWTDAEAEKEAALKLMKEDGADVITYHASLNTAADAADECGVYFIGYNANSEDYSDKMLTSINLYWGTLYENVIANYMKGNMSPGDYYWWGVMYDVVGLEPYSDLVPEDVRQIVDDRFELMMDAVDVFYGELYSNDGKQMCHEQERISDDALLRKMYWYVEGVEVYED